MTLGNWLFSYGTLRQPAVQRAVFGREIGSVPDVLTGFVLDLVTITDVEVIAKSGSDRHPILRPGTDDHAIEGFVLLLSDADLAAPTVMRSLAM